MPLPDLNEAGELPQGVHRPTIVEVVARFGNESAQRTEVTRSLERIYNLALSTGAMDRLIIFGSYVTDKPEPNDVDVILVMLDSFDPAGLSGDVQTLFDHDRAAVEFGASVFYVRPAFLFGEPMDEFIRHWQVKRDNSLRGIVEVRL